MPMAAVFPLVDTEAPRPVPGLIWAFRFGPDGSAEQLPIDHAIALEEPDDGWLWLHFNLMDQRSRHWLTASPQLHSTARDALLSPQEHPQLQMAEDCFFGALVDTVRSLDGAADETCHWRFAMTERMLVSGCRHSLRALETTRQAVERGLPLPVPASVLESVVGEMLADMERSVGELSAGFDKVEDRVLDDAVHDERRRLSSLRRRAVRVHRRLVGLVTSFHRLEHSHAGDLGPILRATAGRIVQRLAALDHEVIAMQDRGRLLQEEIAAKLAAESNSHLHALSILTSLFLPPTLVVGIFGMNTPGLPLTESNEGFLWAILLCVVSSAAVYGVLKRVRYLLRRSGLPD
jgi:zinc transporter